MIAIFMALYAAPVRLRQPLRMMAGGTQQREATDAANNARRSRFHSSSIGPDLVVAPSNKVYRNAAAALLRPDDVVLECGCQLGATTAVLANNAKTVIGIDMARSLDRSSNWGGAYRSHATAREAGLPDNTVLHIADPRDLLSIQELCRDEAVSVILIDANDAVGNDLPLDLLALVRQLSRALAPSLRTVLVKSRLLDRLRSQLASAASIIDEVGGEGGREGGGEGGGKGGELPPLPPLRSGAVRIVGAMGVLEYRGAAERLLEPGYRVLEIGCHTGTSTAQLADHAATIACAGVDVSASIIERARKLHPQVSAFEVCDAWDVAGLLRVARRHLPAHADHSISSSGGGKEAEAGPELLLVDVGGLSGAHGELDTLALIRTLGSAFSPTLKAIVVKSLCLRTLALQLSSGYAVARDAAGEATHE